MSAVQVWVSPRRGSFLLCFSPVEGRGGICCIFRERATHKSDGFSDRIFLPERRSESSRFPDFFFGKRGENRTASASKRENRLAGSLSLRPTTAVRKKSFPSDFPVFAFAGVVDASVAFLFLFFSAKKLGFFFSCLFFFAAWFSFEFCGALLCRAVSNFHARRMILSETSPEPLCLTL